MPRPVTLQSKNCLQCKNIFQPKDRYRKFCSPQCFSLSQKGKKRNNLPSDWREKWEANRGAAIKGRKKTEEHKKKIGLAHKGKRHEYQEGDKNWSWRGGVSKLRKEPNEQRKNWIWRNYILTFNKKACVNCGSKDNLEVDHILPWSFYPELRYEITNGQILCHDCHKNKTMKEQLAYNKNRL